MNIEIVKTDKKEDLEEVYGGNIPSIHPHHYIQSRLNDRLVFVAKINGTPAGFLIYTIWWGNCPFIELLKVKEEYQRKNIGKSLLKAAAKEIKSQNFKSLISSSEVINDVGKNFHIKNGFEKLNGLNLPHGEEQFFKLNLGEFA